MELISKLEVHLLYSKSRIYQLEKDSCFQFPNAVVLYPHLGDSRLALRSVNFFSFRAKFSFFVNGHILHRHS